MSAPRVRVVLTELDDLPELPAEQRVTADEYLAGEASAGGVVVNLCRSYRYRTKGYYVSLLADARGQRVVPSVDAIEGLAQPFGLARVLQEAAIPTLAGVQLRHRRRPLPTTIAPIADREPDAGRPGTTPLLRAGRGGEARYRPVGDAEAVEVLAMFGRTDDARFQPAARALYREWPTPVLRLQFVHEDGDWKVAYAAPVALSQLSDAARAALVRALHDDALLRGLTPAPPRLKRASIAVLTDPDDRFSPSTPETLDRLERVAARRNVHVHRIGPDDINRLGDYDALFIRTLTGVREPSFQFALRAEALDMPVIDDPQSIIRCSNKVFLDELLRREGIPTPRTRVVTSRTPWEQLCELGLPLVLKLPDGSFSAEVHKCGSAEEFRARSTEMFRRSPLLIAQEFLPTEFDWRVVVLDGRVLFTARYHMARGHWQIRAEDASGARYGRVEAVPRDRAPREVRELALRAAALIGTGIYGVDLKESDRGPVVIEINDNPNLDVGYDDAADGARIYEDLVEFFVRRIEGQDEAAGTQGRGAPAGSAARSGAAAGEPGGGGPPPRHAREPRHYRPFQVAGMELEYAVVDRDLNAASLVEGAFRVLAGRPTSDVELDGIGFSNEIADHVLELKTARPLRSLRETEERLAAGVQRFNALLRERFAARLLPTGMHPWLDPRRARLWQRSNARVYNTYARLFDVHTHGWLNVQAAHLNLPFGREDEAVAMLAAASLLIPYLPALAASSPMYDGELQEAVDGRLWWILRHQARIPESQGELVPEPVRSFADYRQRILRPMYRALEALPDAGAVRHDFFNARGAVFKFAGKRMELRVLDTQECVKMDVAIAVFCRAALKHLSARVLAGRLQPPAHALLVEDFHACVRDGSRARVVAPHLPDAPRDEHGRTTARDALRALLASAHRTVRRDEADYLALVERATETGSLSERIRAALLPYVDDEEEFTEAARRIYVRLADCLEANELWEGRTREEETRNRKQ